METHKKWHDRNINYLKKFYEKDEYLQIDYSSNQTRCLIRCQIRSLSRGVCHYDFNEGFNLPDDYSYLREFWDELYMYYKSYVEMTAKQPRSQCEADLYTDEQIWLGLSTVHDGIDFVAGTCQVNGEGFGLTLITTSTRDGSISQPYDGAPSTTSPA